MFFLPAWRFCSRFLLTRTKINKQQTGMQTEDADVTYMREVWMNKSNKKAKRQSKDINMSVWMMVLMMAMITGNPTIAGVHVLMHGGRIK